MDRAPTNAELTRARHFAGQLLRGIGPLCDQMQLTRGEMEIGLMFVLAESLSHLESSGERSRRLASLADTALDVAADFAAGRTDTGGSVEMGKRAEGEALRQQVEHAEYRAIREAMRPVILNWLKHSTAIGDVKVALGDLAEDVVDDVAADFFSDHDRPFNDQDLDERIRPEE